MTGYSVVIPLAPRIVRASRATASASRTLLSLPTPTRRGCGLAGALALPEPPRHELRLLELQHHVDELALGELEAGDRPPVLHARLRVLERRLVTRAPGADRAPADAVARLVQARERPAHALDLGQHRVGGQAHVVERELGADRRAQRQLVVDVRDREALGV